MDEKIIDEKIINKKVTELNIYGKKIPVNSNIYGIFMSDTMEPESYRCFSKDFVLFLSESMQEDEFKLYFKGVLKASKRQLDELDTIDSRIANALIHRRQFIQNTYELSEKICDN